MSECICGRTTTHWALREAIGQAVHKPAGVFRPVSVGHMRGPFAKFAVITGNGLAGLAPGQLLTPKMSAPPPALVMLSVCALIAIGAAQFVANDVRLAAIIAFGGLIIVLAAVVAHRVLTGPGAVVAGDPAPRHQDSDRLCPDPHDELLLTEFAQTLLTALAAGDVRHVLSQELSRILNVERWWITCGVHGRTEVIAPDAVTSIAHMRDGQTWTTFGLRVQGAAIGWLGVDTSVPLGRLTQQRLRTVAPTIAHTLQLTQTLAALRDASVLDPVTGMMTRRAGLDRLDMELKRAHRQGTALAVLMLDLDHFKNINDQYGHLTGDAVLRATGAALARRLRASDIKCRFGGEEFLLALTDTDLAHAETVAHGLLQEIRTAVVMTTMGPAHTTGSIGVTLSRPGELDAEAIIRRADAALYAAKAAGRNCLRSVVADPELNMLSVGQDTRDSTGAPLPLADRRNPNRADRRRSPGPGRRRTDVRTG